MDNSPALAGVLTDIANGPRLNSYQALTEALLRRLSENGLTLDECASSKVMNRSRRTLEGYCRKFEIQFPDYVPEVMRPRDWRKRLKGGGLTMISWLSHHRTHDACLFACGVAVLVMMAMGIANMEVPQ